MKKPLHDILAALNQAGPETAVTPLQGPTQQNPAVITLCCDSRKAISGSLFFCLMGKQSDGHQFAIAAYHKGCRAFMVEKPIANLPMDAAQFRVPDTRKALADAAAFFNNHPERRMRLIGITGTKGKTTTALIIRSLLEQAGIPAGYIGTNGVEFGGRHFETKNSTPESLEIYHYLGRMYETGIRVAVMEVSSQALWMQRTRGLAFDTCLFTNLSPDHIGKLEHPDFAQYKSCKRLLFTDYPLETAVIPAENPDALYMVEGVKAPLLRYGLAVRADSPVVQDTAFAAWDVRPAREEGHIGVSFACSHNGTPVGGTHFLPLPGDFNVMNALAALTVVCERFGLDAAESLDRLAGVVVPGRFEVLNFPARPHVTFVIDYAHNGVSLSSILDALRAYEPNRLICLFGSVGGRSKGRRVDLARAAAYRADLCILTSDNPGPEFAEEIIKEIDEAFPEDACPRLCIPDRAEAIKRAVSIAQDGDIILLAGKGHETHQLIGTRFEYFSEREILESLLAPQKLTR